MEQGYFITPRKKEVIKKIKDWCSTRVLYETCGFLGKKGEEYIAVLCENKSQDPRNNFSIDPVEYLLFLEEYELIAVFHSHISGDEEPSEKDIIMSENSCLPFFIYSLNTQKTKIYMPQKPHVDVNTIREFEKLS